MRITTFNLNGLAGMDVAGDKAWKVFAIDILCLGETWLRPTNEVHIGLPHDVLSLEAPQSGRPHGGIVFLSLPDLKTRAMARSATKSYQVLAIHMKPGLNVVGVYITKKCRTNCNLRVSLRLKIALPRADCFHSRLER